jgi:hypothetical protein
VRLVIAAVVCLALAGCDFGSADRLSPEADQEAETAVARVRAEWEAELARGAREWPSRHFPNLSRQEFLGRLRAAATRYDFKIVDVEFRRPKQLAPRVVVQSDDVEALASAYSRFWRSIDPKARTADDRIGWAFEGFYFEARDAESLPAFVVYHWWRARESVGGGQWAREESFYPFEHG